MKGRFGAPVQVGYSEVELIWLTAANTLDAHERVSALMDVASMMGRSFEAVSRKASALRKEAAQKVLEKAREEAARRIMVPSRRMPADTSHVPSDFRWKDRHGLRTAGSAKVARQKPVVIQT